MIIGKTNGSNNDVMGNNSNNVMGLIDGVIGFVGG